MLTGLNVGCGQRCFSSTLAMQWINVDKIARAEMPAPDWECDGGSLPSEDNSVDLFVLHHVLEHFGCNEANGLLKEAYRVLKPGGSLLIFVPDVFMLAKRWLAGELNTQLYLTNMYGAYMGSEEDRHKWGYTWQSLIRSIEESEKWKEILRFDWRPIPGADIARDWWILGMEAIK